MRIIGTISINVILPGDYLKTIAIPKQPNNKYRIADIGTAVNDVQYTKYIWNALIRATEPAKSNEAEIVLFGQDTVYLDTVACKTI